jgi:hypothetical protein
MQRRMGRAVAARQSDIRVRDGTEGVAGTRRCGGEEGAERIRRFFSFFLERLGARASGEWSSGCIAAHYRHRPGGWTSYAQHYSYE